MDESMKAAALRETVEEAGVRGTIEVSEFIHGLAMQNDFSKSRS